MLRRSQVDEAPETPGENGLATLSVLVPALRGLLGCDAGASSRAVRATLVDSAHQCA